MKINSYLSSLIILALLSTLFACGNNNNNDDDDNSNPNLIEHEVVLDATAYDSWVYYSLEQMKEVNVTDFTNDLSWDIAFHRFDVRVNCGTSGSGQGGTYDAGVVDFESVLEAPEHGYSLNDSIQIIETSGNWDYVTVPGDTVFTSWLTFSGPPPAYTINNNIFVIKTADGKFAKVWLKDYYNDQAQTGHVTMKYALQPDESRSFQ